MDGMEYVQGLNNLWMGVTPKMSAWRRRYFDGIDARIGRVSAGTMRGKRTLCRKGYETGDRYGRWGVRTVFFLVLYQDVYGICHPVRGSDERDRWGP